MNNNRDRLATLQTQISTGKTFQDPSENPSAAAGVLTIKSTLLASEGYLTNAEIINSWLDATDEALNNLTAVTIQARSLILRGLNDTLDSQERLGALAPEMDGLIDQAITTGNTSHMDRYIFAGFQTSTKPFEYSTTVPNTVEYHGDAGIMNQELGPGQSVAVNTNGNTAFSPVITALIRARNALQANDRTELEAGLTDLQNALSPINDAISTNGTKMRHVDTVVARLEKTNVSLKSLLSKREDVNMAEAIAQLSSQETSYQAVLEVSQRAISALNLFDVLQ
jgi:flagellar hook-associated protein 3 FlgL